jgi:hypothetical protein
VPGGFADYGRYQIAELHCAGEALCTVPLPITGVNLVNVPEFAPAAGCEDDRIEIDVANGTIQRGNKQYAFPKFPDSVRQLLELGESVK